MCIRDRFFIGQARQQLPYEPLTLEEIQQVRAAAPIETPLREGVVEAGLELLGKVNYFWGGKSTAEGMEDVYKRQGVYMKSTILIGSHVTKSCLLYTSRCV